MLRYPELVCAAVPELASARGFDQRSVYHAFNVYEHIARVLTVAGAGAVRRRRALVEPYVGCVFARRFQT